jgi:hypothetical protein
MRLNHSFKGGLLFLQPLSVFAQLLAQGLQFYDLLARLLLMLSQQLDLLDSFIQISDQSMSQLHLISEASHTVVTSSKQYHNFCSFFSSAREVAVLRMHHLLIRLMSQDSQCFTACLSHACLERPPQCRSLDHLTNVVDTIGRRPLVDHHTYTLKVRVSTQQSRDSNEERGLAGTQR